MTKQIKTSASKASPRAALKARSSLLVLGLACGLTLAGCQSAEEKADAFFASGQELRAEGDADRAIVEFRNVFRYDESHQEARRALAEILLAQGDLGRAYRQYLRLSEFHPADLDARGALAVIAMEAGDWEEARRHGTRVVEAEPDSVRARTIDLGLRYREASLIDDAEAKAAAAEEAEALLAEAPQTVTLWQIVITERTATDPDAGLDGLDRLIELRPAELEYWTAKLRLLTSLDRIEEARAHLDALQVAFPDDAEATQLLVAWYLNQGENDAAIAALRRDAGDDTGNPLDHAVVIDLIRQLQGPDAAVAEIERLIAANAKNPANVAHYRGLRATEMLRRGERAAAEAELREVVAETDLPGRLLWIKALLADLLRTDGNEEEAGVLVEEILARDATNVDALKLRGTMLISSDRPDEAIVDLRRALDQNPRDSGVLLLLAEAHQRAGSPELMGERLAAAVEVSGNGVPETLRYVAFLISQGRVAAARSLLTETRRAHPQDVSLLTQVGRFALRENDLGLVQGVVRDLDSIESPEAAEVADVLRSAVLLQQNRSEEGIELLTRQAGEAGQNAQAVLAVIVAWAQSGQPEQGRLYLDRLRAESPDDLELRLVDGALSLSEGATERSEELMRGIIEDAVDSPQAVGAMRSLFEQLLAADRDAEVGELLDATLAAQPENRTLLLLRAAFLERQDRIPEAIEIYEDLYERDSSDVLVANNLASLLAAYRMDAESGERATRIAQRLRGTTVPQFQDTYGWIAYRNGRFEDAVAYLEPAAAELRDDPVVQYHVGMTYRALGRDREAADTLRRALEMAGDAGLPQMDEAREALAEVEARAAADAAPAGAPETGEAAPGSAEPLPEGNATSN
ncbi:tetratricopeptide repeat protein [Jannaschia sp. W003]|uniref:tetratricopeptide repeat protein n=1 Tax=Jannaschia sp. W003 TaxID=2867012 RepID=UPI0021A456FB|nr:tetratricopeptide repeat protein [Jannaschia sp. W003]UWQ23210.1 tetratricopeptide repeat protein [Jannaschia sp. W003]